MILLVGLLAGHAQIQAAASAGAPAVAAVADKSFSSAKNRAAATYLQAPLGFEPNRGQVNATVRFVSHGTGYSLALTDSAAILTLHKRGSLLDRPGIARLLDRGRKPRTARSKSVENEVIRMELAGAGPAHDVSGSNPLGGTSNYFIGKDPAKWQSKVPVYARVRYGSVYPGVDLVYYGNQRHLEYDFIVAPHAEPKQIRLRFSGAQNLKLDQGGNLEVIDDDGEVVFQKPALYQEINGRHVPVDGRFTLLAKHTVGFKIGGYDRAKPLVIDPTLSYSTYLGGSTYTAGTAIAVDTAGSIYVIGFTADIDFPVTAGAFQTTQGANNEVAFVTKFNAAGSALLYSTYLGGTSGSTDTGSDGNDAFGIAVDAAGSAYISGETYSNDFPVTSGAFQATNKGFAHNAQNVFVSKLSADGSALVYSTYLGGSGLDITADDFFDGDSPLRMAVDAAGSAYIVGTAYSTDFPTTPGAYQLTNKAAANLASNAFVTKLSPDGKSLVYSTYLGGTGVSPTALDGGQDEGGGEAGYGVAVDAAGEAYVTGYTFSSDFPVTGKGYQQTNLGAANFAANAFVSKLNAAGTGLAASTYLGGSGDANGTDQLSLDASENGDDGIGVTLDATGNAYVVGVTSSKDFPTSATAFQKTNNAAASFASNVFVSKLDPALSTLLYSTYLGGSGVKTSDTNTGEGDFGTGIAVDTAGDAYITGATESPDFPVTTDALQKAPLGAQVVDSGFFAELNPTGSALQYSTYMGGSGAGSYGGSGDSFFEGDFFYDLTLDASNNAYLTGYAYSYDFPVTQDAFQRVNNAGGGPGGNAIVVKFGATAGLTYLPTTTTLSSTISGANVTFTALAKPTTGTGIPTGTIIFYVNSTKATTVTLDATGSATYTTDQLADTLNNVIAAYSGDATYGASGSSLGQNPSSPTSTATQLVFTTPPAAAIGAGGNGGTAVVAVEDASGNLVTNADATVTISITGPSGYTPQTNSASTDGGIASFSFGNFPLTLAGNYTYTATSSGLTAATAVETVAPVSSTTPTIVSLTPNSAIVGVGDLTVTVSGTQFVTGAAITVNGTSQSATFVSATQLTTTITAAQLATVGTLSLVVVNPDGGGSNTSAFTVIAQPVQLAPATLDFGNQTVGVQTAPQVVTVTNTASTAVTINGIALTFGPNPSDFAQTNTCPTSLAAGATCQISITFTPGGVGAKTAGVGIYDTSPPQPQFVNLSGTGTGGILQVSPGNLKTIAGDGTVGYTGDGGPAIAAELNSPSELGYDTAGNLYIADQLNNVVRKVDTSGNITTVAGNGTAGFSGDGGPATSAQLHAPAGVVADAAGNLYIQDLANARVRKVDTTGVITTFAGNGQKGFAGDGGPATSAEFNQNQGARFDAAGNLYVPQCVNAAVRKIDPNGIITTVAGTGVNGFSGDGGAATAAQLDCPSGVAVDAAGNIFIADFGNNLIRKVDANGIITTVAGTGNIGFSGDGGPAVAAALNIPNDVDVDAAGNVYIADAGNNRLRKIDATGVITTVAGGLNNAGSAGINTPLGITLDTAGNLYFTDTGNNAVREVFPAGAVSFPATAVGTAATAETVTLSNIGNIPVVIASPASFGLSGNTTDFSLLGGSCLTGATLAANGGSCTLEIGFTPTATGARSLTVAITDDAVYSPQSFQIGGTGVAKPILPVSLTSISPTGALAGSAATSITATGANFTATSVVNFNGAPLATTFVSATQLTATVPAALLTAAASANVTVLDPVSASTSLPEIFTVLPGTPGVTFSAPPTSPGDQPTLNFQLTQGYPVALTGTMTLTFTPDAGNPDNPQVQLATTSAGGTLATGGRTLTFPLAANSAVTPVVMVQVGNVSGTITITLHLTSGGVDVTPATVVPVTILVPRAAPTISSLSFSASGNTLTVLVTGFSTTREIQSATFAFTPATGASLSQKSLTVTGTTLFQGWYTTADSAQFGSAFTYTQLFTLSGNASAVGGVGVTLTNTVGTSTEVTAP